MPHQPRAARRARPLTRPVAAAVCAALVVGLLNAPVAQHANAAVGTADVFGWGTNTRGQLGSAGQSVQTPTQVDLPAGVQPVDVAAGADFTLVSGSDGVLYALGANTYGQLGDGTTTSRPAAARVQLPGPVTAVSVHSWGPLAVTSDGTIFWWGFRSDQPDLASPTPQSLTLPGGVPAVAVASGFGLGPVNLAVGADHHVYSWPTGPSAPGFPPEAPQLFAPTADILASAVTIGGFNGNLLYELLAVDGQVYTWGTGFSYVPATPTVVPLPSGAAAVQISTGAQWLSAIDSSGQIYDWGLNGSGQLGDGTRTSSATPVLAHLPEGVTAVTVSAGAANALAVGSDGVVYAWGAGTGYALGNGTTGDSLTPTGVPLPEGSSATAVAASGAFSVAVVSQIPFLPRFIAAAPPTSVNEADQLTYQFRAAGRPSPAYSLSADAPSWLHIDPASGVLTGTAPVAGATSSYSVIATNTEGAVTAGPFQLLTGPRTAVTGTVVLGTDPVPGAFINGCSQSACASTTTAADGTFSLPWFTGTDVTLTVYPPRTIAFASVLPSSLPAQPVGSGGLNLTISLSQPGLSTASVTGIGISSQGLPVVHWAKSSPVEFTGCAHGLGALTVIGHEGALVASHVFLIPEEPAGSGHYAGTMPALQPMHGPAKVTSDVLCPGTLPALPAGTSPTRAVAAAATARLLPAGNSLASALDAIDVADAVNRYGLKFSSVKEYFGIAKVALDAWRTGGCKQNVEVVKKAIGLALTPAVDLFYAAILPEVESYIVASLFIQPLVAGPLLALAPLLLKLALNWVVDKVVDAAVDEAFGNFCDELVPPDPNILIDPSGTVLDTNGNIVGGARVLLLRSDTPAGPFVAMDPNDPGMEPGENPQVTGDDGVFHWDVRAGYYKVQATAAGCHAPGRANQPAAAIGPLPVPPPQVGLVVTLECPSSPPPAQPSVTALDVPVGSPEGGTAVLITGTGFTPAMTVSLGSTPAVVHFYTPTTAQVITPAGTGRTNVSVTTAGGTSDPTPDNTFSYSTRATVTSIDPLHGPLAGGTTVTVHGTGFTDATGVTFGAFPAPQFTVVSPSRIDAVAPALGTAGPVDVEVLNDAGGSPATAGDLYTYDTAQVPTHLTLTPAAATAAAGDSAAYTARAVAADGTDLGDVTASTTFTIAPAAAPASSMGASCSWSACTATTPGRYTVTGTTQGVSGNAGLTVVAASPASIVVTSGDGQVASTGQPFPLPLAVTVTDRFANPVPAALVTFTAGGTGGSFAGQPTTTAVSSATGLATTTVPLTAGSAGQLNVVATVAGLASGATFAEVVQSTGPARADLSIKVTSPASLKRSSTGTITLTVSNLGPSLASPVFSTVRIPRGLAVTSSGGAAVLGDLLVFKTPTLSPGKQVTFVISVRNQTKVAQQALVPAATLSPVKDPKLTNNVSATKVLLN
jgi:hypothetical protein